MYASDGCQEYVPNCQAVDSNAPYSSQLTSAETVPMGVSPVDSGIPMWVWLVLIALGAYVLNEGERGRR